jgi:hypothetical protein
MEGEEDSEAETRRDLTDIELEKEIENLLQSAKAEDKINAHTFLTMVAKAKDTTKTGNLSETELGMLPSTQRSYKELALISGEIMSNDYFKRYFEQEAETLTSTSLSKNAKLIELAVVQRREFSKDGNKPPRKENRGWFHRKTPQLVSAY